MPNYPARHLYKWTREEDERLLKAVRRRIQSFETIVYVHERTKESIRQRLVKLARAGGIPGLDYSFALATDVMAKIQERPAGFTDLVLAKVWGAQSVPVPAAKPLISKEKKSVATKFYNIYSSSGPSENSPRTKDDAIARAKVLAKNHPSSIFFLMEAVESYSMGNPLRRVLKATPAAKKSRTKKDA